MREGGQEWKRNTERQLVLPCCVTTTTLAGWHRQSRPQPAHLLVTTAPPRPSSGMMRDAAPPAAVLGSAMMGTPSRLRAAPRMKSTCRRGRDGRD